MIDDILCLGKDIALAQSPLVGFPIDIMRGHARTLLSRETASGWIHSVR